MLKCLTTLLSSQLINLVFSAVMATSISQSLVVYSLSLCPLCCSCQRFSFGNPYCQSLSVSLSSNYLACWSSELGQWGWPYATLAPSFNIPSQQARSYRSLKESWGVLMVHIYVSYLLVVLFLVGLRNIISQVLVPWVPFHDELFVIDLADHIKVSLFH